MSGSRQLTPPSLMVVAGVCGFFGLYNWAVFGVTFNHDGLLGPRHNAPGADWMVFYSAARAYLEGNLSLIFDGDRFTAYQNETFAGWLSVPLPFHPWVYPPHYLLLVLPFGLLPFALSYAAFIAVSFAALVVAIWCSVEGRRQRWLMLLSVVLAPAASLNVIEGQNAFLTSALLVGGFGLISIYPVLAGLLLGILTCKPTLWLMVPVALVAARRWRTLASTAVTAGILAAVSLCVFGWEVWRFWLGTVVSANGDFYQNWLESGRLWGQSIYTCARLLGASHGMANVAQASATLSAGGIVYWTFRRSLPSDVQLIVLLAAAILAGPHIQGYDDMLLAIAAALFFCRAVADDLPFVNVILALTVWLAPPFLQPRLHIAAFALPIVVGLFIASAISSASLRSTATATAAA